MAGKVWRLEPGQFALARVEAHGPFVAYDDDGNTVCASSAIQAGNGRYHKVAASGLRVLAVLRCFDVQVAISPSRLPAHLGQFAGKKVSRATNVANDRLWW